MKSYQKFILSVQKKFVVSKQLDEETIKTLKERCQATISYEDSDELLDEAEQLISHLDEKLKTAFLTLYAYLRRTQKRSLDHLQKVQVFELEQTMKIDLYSKRNLELTETIRSKKAKRALFIMLLDVRQKKKQRWAADCSSNGSTGRSFAFRKLTSVRKWCKF
ncbi:hypothetical protein BsIDN1_31760 [Bacillus safensis]|uniref:Uncharacterized protein n=1 Tax=Bacillus safensis TaxID=561879 RepID=A0A5S9M9K4_BACIA|nr:hypothetical protein BsIDN1_31760 [Bacillus safensis]